MSCRAATDLCAPEGTDLSAAHKYLSPAHKDSCSAHKDNCSGHNDNCSAHNSRCATHKDSCSAHKYLSLVLSGRTPADKYLSRPHNWGCVAHNWGCVAHKYLSPADNWWSTEASANPRAYTEAPLRDCEWRQEGSDLPSALKWNCAGHLFLNSEAFQSHVTDPEKRRFFSNLDHFSRVRTLLSSY
jgi:hypothetical protein